MARSVGTCLLPLSAQGSARLLAMAIPMDERNRPVEVRIDVSTGAGVEIRWSDGHASHYDFRYLREECPCASCNDERGKKTALPAVSSGPVLPMFKPAAKARAAKAVGNYAVQIDFTDGHSTGIYSFAYLREMCPCAECKKAR